MSGFNMPPGVSPNDIPGNEPDDGDMEAAIDKIVDDSEEQRMCAEDVEFVWALGLHAWKEFRKYEDWRVRSLQDESVDEPIDALEEDAP